MQTVQDIQAQIAALKQAQKEARKQERIAARAAAKEQLNEQAKIAYAAVIESLAAVNVTERDFIAYVKTHKQQEQV